MYKCFACVNACAPHTHIVPIDLGSSCGFLEPRLNGFDSLCMCWKPNPGFLQEQQLFLTTDSSLQACIACNF